MMVSNVDRNGSRNMVAVKKIISRSNTITHVNIPCCFKPASSYLLCESSDVMGTNEIKTAKTTKKQREIKVSEYNCERRVEKDSEQRKAKKIDKHRKSVNGMST